MRWGRFNLNFTAVVRSAALRRACSIAIAGTVIVGGAGRLDAAGVDGFDQRPSDGRRRGNAPRRRERADLGYADRCADQ